MATATDPSGQAPADDEAEAIEVDPSEHEELVEVDADPVEYLTDEAVAEILAGDTVVLPGAHPDWGEESETVIAEFSDLFLQRFVAPWPDHPLAAEAGEPVSVEFFRDGRLAELPGSIADSGVRFEVDGWSYVAIAGFGPDDECDPMDPSPQLIFEEDGAWYGVVAKPAPNCSGNFTMESLAVFASEAVRCSGGRGTITCTER